MTNEIQQAVACWEEGEGDSSPALQPRGGAHSLPVGRTRGHGGQYCTLSLLLVEGGEAGLSLQPLPLSSSPSCHTPCRDKPSLALQPRGAARGNEG